MHLRFILLPFLLYALPASALIDFYGYREVEKDDIIYYKSERLGYSELERSELTVKPYGTYLDITEDGWISSDVNKLNVEGMISDFLFKGTIPIPVNAVATGLQTWRGEQLYRAILRESKYITDKTFEDSTTLQQSLDSRIALLQQHSESVFELTLARVKLGERIHVRIRYLLRPTNNQTGQFTVPVLFHTAHGATPQYTGITLFANGKEDVFTLTGSEGSYRITDTTTTMLPYQQTITLQYSREENSVIALTEFTDESYSGNYLSVNTSVTDSIIRQLSKPIATVFIWRWNGPKPMTTFSNDLRTLSSYARTIIDQASMMRETIKELHKLGNSCALLHSIEGKSTYAFHSQKIASLTDSSVLSYLETMNEMDLYEKYKDERSPVPEWVVQESSSETEIQASRDDFLETLAQARSLLEKASGATFRHIVIIAAGTPSSTNTKDLSEDISIDDETITIYHESVTWLGVDIGASLTSGSIYSWSNYSFPPFSPTTIQLSIDNRERSYTFPLEQTEWNGAFTVTARTAPQWDTLLTWTGFDEEGFKTAVVTEQPAIYRLHADSGLAKVWAGDNSHIAEKDEVYPGGTFGILTKATFLQATIEDMVSDGSSSVPFLTDEEIAAPQSSAVIRKLSSRSRQPVVRIARGMLILNASTTFRVLYIYDLKGRLLLKYRLDRALRQGNNYLIPLHKLLQRHTTGIFVLKFAGATSAVSFQLINGRIQ